MESFIKIKGMMNENECHYVPNLKVPCNKINASISKINFFMHQNSEVTCSIFTTYVAQQ